MSRPVSTTAAADALRRHIDAHVREVAAGNNYVSRQESPDLHPYLRRIEQLLRDEGGPGTWVRVDRLIDRAMLEAMLAWDRVNPPDNPRDHLWLAKAEIAVLATEAPALAELTKLAYDAVRASFDDQSAPAPAPGVDSPRAWIESTDFRAASLHRAPLPNAQLVDAREGRASRAEVPVGVLAVFDSHHRIETANEGAVSLRRGEIAGRTIWVIATTTDDDRGFIEILDDAGAPLVGARLHLDQVLAFDAFPGRLRLARAFTTVSGFTREEGMSEPDERAALGQPSREWAGDVVIDEGSLDRAGPLLGQVDTGGVELDDEQRELAIAAFEHVWEVHLRHTVFGDEAVIIGPRRQGVLIIGAFERNTDEIIYETAWWRDIDDASFVLYYRRGPHGLELTTEQFDN